MQQRNSCEPVLAVSEPDKAPQLKVKRSCRHACKEGLPDGIISTHDEDEDDNDADDGGATKLLPHVYSFIGSATQAPADDAEWELPVATPASHAPSRATALSSSGATSVTTSASASVGGRGRTRAPDATLTLQIAEAVAEAIRRTEAIAAARYERALISFRPSSPHSRQESRRRRERGVRGWGLGECGRTLPDTQICQ